MKIHIAAIIFLLFGSTLDAQQGKSSYQTKYVVILVIDGPRYSETYGDSSCRLSPVDNF
jgi:hypothetical protein